MTLETRLKEAKEPMTLDKRLAEIEDRLAKATPIEGVNTGWVWELTNCFQCNQLTNDWFGSDGNPFCENHRPALSVSRADEMRAALIDAKKACQALRVAERALKNIECHRACPCSEGSVCGIHVDSREALASMARVMGDVCPSNTNVCGEDTK